MKKVTALFLILLFLYSSCGFYFLQFGYLSNCNSALAVKRNKNKLTRLNLMAADFTRVGDDEILYGGNLYDVVKEEQKGIHVVFFVIQDDQENSILANIKAHLENSGNGSAKGPFVPFKQIVKSIDKEFYSSEPCSDFQPFTLYRKYVQELNRGIPEFFLSCFSPPPWNS